MLAFALMKGFLIIMAGIVRRGKLFFANLFWMVLCFKRNYYFRAAACNVEKSQKRVLVSILKKNRDTAFGREHRFASITDTAEFQSRVRLYTYDSYKGYIDSIAQGEKAVITSEPIVLLEPSSGSTSGSKYIPYTRSLYEEFKNGLSPWIFDLFTKKWQLLRGSAYWSISPITKTNKANSKIPVGFGNDASYFGRIERILLHTIFAVPSIVSEIEDGETFRYVTLRFLLCDKHLVFISIWNPSFLLLLLEPLAQWFPQLISDIENGTLVTLGSINSGLKRRLLKKCYRDKQRAKELKDIFAHLDAEKLCLVDKKSIYEKIWPNLALISCWADSHAAQQLKELEMLFPNIEIQPKGLLSTEGIISFPLLGEKGAVLSIRSHFFEFIDIKNEFQNSSDVCNTKLAHQLEKEKLYSVVLTTGGGLYRYRLQDIIKVVGYKNQCPLVQFISKESHISDLAGEKLNEFHVATILNDIFNTYSLKPSFFLLAPERSAKKGTHFYALFLKLQEDNSPGNYMLSSLAQELEKRLKENYHYAHCLNLGQLLSANLFVIKHNSNAASIYMDICRKGGQKIGNIKPAVLSLRVGWSEYFEGSFIGGLNVQAGHACVSREK